MPRDLAKWVEQLLQFLQNLTSPPTRDPETELWDRFHEMPGERSLFGIATVMAIAIGTFLLMGIALGIFALGHRLIVPDEMLQSVEDLRLTRDYRSHPAADLAVLDDRNAIVATRGGGLHQLRLDGGPLGFWRAFDRRSTGNLLPEDDIRQVFADRHRLFFVGASGSLASSDRWLGDWRLHFGAGGFVPSLDLTEQLTALAVSPDRTLLAVGTRDHGAALYDTVTRQWRRLVFGEDHRVEDRVNSLLWKEGQLWVGTETGLSVFEVHRERGRLQLSALSNRYLPEPFHGKPVRAIQCAGEGRKEVVHCMVGRGAHLRTPAHRSAWSIIVDEGDASLGDLSGPAEVGSLLPVTGGAWLDLPPYGPAFYNAAQRRLILRNQVVGETTLSNENSHSPRLIGSPNLGERSPEVWISAVNRLYRRGKVAWEPGPAFSAPISELTFSGQKPLVRLDTGEISAAGDDGSQGAVFFAADQHGSNPEAAEVGGGQLFVSHSGGDVSRYLPAVRGWERIATGGGEGENSSVRQLRWGEGSLWIVRKDGEIAHLSPPGGSSYSPLVPRGDLPAKPGRIVTAADLAGDLWFIREAEATWDPWVYNRDGRSIRQETVGIAKEFTPQRLRAVGDKLYLWGREKGALRLYARTSESTWGRVDGDIDDLTEILATPQILLARRASGPLQVMNTGSAPLLDGQGYVRWRKLQTDRFGHLWGLAEDGSVACYQRSTGSWTHWPLRAADLLVRPLDTGHDRIFVGAAQGIAVWTVDAGGTVQEPGWLTGVSAQSARLDFQAGILWALGSDPQTGSKTLWRSDLSGQKVRRLWAAAAPAEAASSAEPWRRAVWARFVGEEIWWSTLNGEFWTYSLSLSAPRTTFRQVGTGPARKVEVEGADLIWWLDTDGFLKIVEMPEGAISVLGRFQVDLDKLERQAGWLLKLGLTCLGLASMGLVALVFRFISRRRWIVSFALVSGASLALYWYIVRQEIEPTKAFENQDFHGKVQTFWLEGGDLIVQTDEGVWTFGHKGTHVWPKFHSLEARRQDVQEAEPKISEHPSGNWKVMRGRAGLNLEYRGENGWQEVRPGLDGLPGDDLHSFVVRDDRIFAGTFEGVVEYQIGETLEWARFTPIPTGPTDLAAEGNSLWLRSGSGVPFRYDPHTQQRWQASHPPAPRVHGTDGVRWRSTPFFAELLQPNFDPGTGRFLADSVVGLLRDTRSTAWIRTLAGWRRVVISGGAVHLDEPVARSPALAPETEVWPVDTHWRCRRTLLDDSDVIEFLFPGRPPLNDPFGNRGRWPDQDAQAVLPNGKIAWIATPLGVRRGRAEGLGDLELPGKQILALDRQGQTIYARAADGDYARTEIGWSRVASVPAGLFQPVRVLRLPLGEGLTITAVERPDGSGPRTELPGFEPYLGRFPHDVVQEIEGDRDGFWVLTPLGVQHLPVKDGRIAEHRIDLAGRPIVALRRGTGGGLYALEAGTRVWRYTGRRWEPTTKDPADPFTYPPQGSLSQVVHWRRLYDPAGDRFQLRTSLGPLTFAEGKLASDFVLSAAGEGREYVEATRAGIVTPRGILPNPPGTGAEGPTLALDHVTLLARTSAGTYRHDPGTKSWAPSPTPPALAVPEARFDGLHWQVQLRNAENPRFFWAMATSDEAKILLDGRGHFPFDAVQGIMGMPGEIWVIHKLGATIYPAGLKETERFSPIRWLPDRYLLHVANTPYWRGRLGGEQVTVRLLGSQVIQVEREGEKPLRRSLSEPVLRLAGARGAVWILTPSRLYRLKLP